MFIAQILQKLVEEEGDILEEPRKAIAMDRKGLCLGQNLEYRDWSWYPEKKFG